jgi:hypothetical protein
MSKDVKQVVHLRELLTNLIQHLVALIENEGLDAVEAELLVSNQGVQPARSGDNDIWVSLLA